MWKRAFSSLMLFYTFILFAMGVQSQEILQFDNLVAENINNQTCEAKVNTYMFKMMDRTFNEVSIKSEGIFFLNHLKFFNFLDNTEN